MSYPSFGRGRGRNFNPPSGSIFEYLSSQLNNAGIRRVDVHELREGSLNKIGQGSRSEVFSAETNSGKVAAKTIDVYGQDSRTRKSKEDLLYYLKIFNTLKHENVLELIGVAFSPSIFYELTELCTTDLEKFSADHSVTSAKFPDATYQSIFKETCQGMSYIHSMKILHRDLKADNVLLLRRNNVWCAKVADFGLAKNEGCSKKVPRGPAKLNPPEALICHCENCESQDGYVGGMASLSLQPGGQSAQRRCFHKYHFYRQSDVYMFGVMLYCVSHRTDFFGRLKTGQIVENVKRGQRPEIRTSAVNETFADTIARCWAHEMNARPTFAQLVYNF